MITIGPFEELIGISLGGPRNFYAGLFTVKHSRIAGGWVAVHIDEEPPNTITYKSAANILNDYDGTDFVLVFEVVDNLVPTDEGPELNLPSAKVVFHRESPGFFRQYAKVTIPPDPGDIIWHGNQANLVGDYVQSVHINKEFLYIASMEMDGLNDWYDGSLNSFNDDPPIGIVGPGFRARPVDVNGAPIGEITYNISSWVTRSLPYLEAQYPADVVIEDEGGAFNLILRIRQFGGIFPQVGAQTVAATSKTFAYQERDNGGIVYPGPVPAPGTVMPVYESENELPPRAADFSGEYQTFWRSSSTEYYSDGFISLSNSAGGFSSFDPDGPTSVASPRPSPSSNLGDPWHWQGKQYSFYRGAGSNLYSTFGTSTLDGYAAPASAIEGVKEQIRSKFALGQVLTDVLTGDT